MAQTPPSLSPDFDVRAGERRADRDPAAGPHDAGLVFIGRVASPWMRREDCPKNMRAARESGYAATLLIDEPWRPGLSGLRGFSHVVVLTWLDRGPRDLIVQAPRHATEPRGVFALRSPVRPNPIGLHVARIVAIDRVAGTVEIDAIDILDGTPVIDLKPYIAAIDSFPDAVRGET